MSRTLTGGAVEVEELNEEQGQELLESQAQEKFGTSWGEFLEAYESGAFIGTDRARLAEELAFLAPFAG